METVDIILSCFLGYGFIRGIWKGFIYELASFLSLAVGIYVTIHFSYWIKGWIEVGFNYHSEYLNVISFVITFALTVLGIMSIAKLLTTMANLVSLGLINRALGGVFGTLKILLFLSVILYFFNNLNQSEALVEHKVLKKSVLLEPILLISKEAYPIIQEYFPEVIDQKDKLEKAI